MSKDFAQTPVRFIAACAGLESPSLFRREANEDAAPPAYEVKFLLSEEQAQSIEARLRDRLAPDPHADPTLGGAYRITSVYTDTAQFDVFRRIGEYGRSKLRVRRYGHGGPVFVERKDKNGDKVRKHRAQVTVAELAVLTAPTVPANWSGEWFHQQLATRRLAPVCRVTYDRVAFMGMADGSAVRMTFDRKVRGEATDHWEPIPVGTGAELLPGQVICEFKYRLAMPLLFKEIVQTLGLNPSTCSKYRRFMEAAGIAPPLVPEAAAPMTNGGRANG